MFLSVIFTIHSDIVKHPKGLLASMSQNAPNGYAEGYRMIMHRKPLGADVCDRVTVRKCRSEENNAHMDKD